MVILHIGMDSIGATKRNLLNPDELIQLDNTKEISVGIKHIKISCLGQDLNLRIDDLAYGYIQDVSELYSVGDKIKVKIIEIDRESYKLKVSVKELLDDPYKNIRIYFIEGGEYVGKITGFAPNRSIH